MLGKVAVYISEEDREYLKYVSKITTLLQIKPHLLHAEELPGIGKTIGELFTDFSLLIVDKDQAVTRLQEEYDLLFIKYRRQLLRKSMTERLLSETEGLRLWVYKEGAKAEIKKVCLPVDFSERSLRQVEFVEALRSFFSFEYRLVYSVNMGRLRYKLSGKDYRKSLSDKEEEVRHMYTDMFGERNTDFIILEGDPYRDLVRHINSSDYDLVVVGRRGKGIKEHVGSVSLHLVRSLKCPVVVL